MPAPPRSCQKSAQGDFNENSIVGSGISGLAAGWLLDRKHEVHVFEKRRRLGGHTHTVVHEVEGRELALDTGFIVYNEATYPNLTRAFAELEVETRASDMSFSVSCRNPDIEYASHSLRGLFAQRSLMYSGELIRMLVDVFRFGRRGRRLLAGTGDPDATIADFLDDGGFSEAFARFFLLPMTAAIWSSGTEVGDPFPRDPAASFSRQPRSPAGYRPTRVENGCRWAAEAISHP